MSQLDGRTTPIPPQRSTAMSKTDDSGSSATPGGISENSVAYQYVAVQQMNTCRDHIEYQLTVREQPKQSRMCGVGEKADRRPIDPAPIVQLRVITHDRPIRQPEVVESASVAPPVERSSGHGPKQPRTPGVRRGLPVSTALGEGWEDKAWYLENPYFFMYAMLCNAETDEELHLLSDGKTRYTSGSCVSCLYHLKDIDGSHQGFFVFPDLSIRVEGRYRLKLCLFETIGHTVHHCKSIYSDPFNVYTAKRFPGMEESTKLSKSFAEQGLKVRVRKHPRSRRRGSKRTKDESDASDAGTPLARDRSPKRTRASDILPASGLEISQPPASRMPRSLDARYERADYDRKPFVASASHDLKGAPSPRPRLHPSWQEEEAMRARDAGGRGTGYDQRLYARQVQEDRERNPAVGRYLDDAPPRDRRAAPLPSASDRGGPGFYEYDRPAHAYDSPARPSLLSRQSINSTSYPSQPSFADQRLPESSAGLSGQHSRNWVDPPTQALRLSHPPTVHPRPHEMPDHAFQRSLRAHDDYRAQPRHDARYDVRYDQRDNGPGRFSPSPPPSGSFDQAGRGAFAPQAPSQWRSGPPSPRRASEYEAASRERDLSARWSPPAPHLRGIATPPAAFVGETRGYARGDYVSVEAGRPSAAYESELSAPASSRVSYRRLVSDHYPRNGGSRSSDLPAAERFGHAMLPSLERPTLPPLLASPSSSHRERDATMGLGLRDREQGYETMLRDRQAGYGSSERYLPPSGYPPRAAPPIDMDFADRERERDGMSMRQQPGRSPKREDSYEAREWDARGIQRRPGGGPPRPY